jgi:hypothetical protein
MPLGENLINKGLITLQQLNEALTEQRKNPQERLGDVIVRLGFATKEQIESALK